MKVTLCTFQEDARDELLDNCESAQKEYCRKGRQQILSLSAPTGAGKTLIMADVIEHILSQQEKAIFLWLSDIKELNEQSMQKIKHETQESLSFVKYIMLDADNSDVETLDDGCVYFLNTQKLSESSRMTGRTGDLRKFTIWETLNNTRREKGERLFVIIDEAHRGTKPGKDTNEAATIMQKFIMGSEKDCLKPMPIVIGVSATIQRFNKLIEGVGNSTTRPYDIPPIVVRDSGLLKDEIIIQHPNKNREMSMLQLAALEWIDKCARWKAYHEREGGKQVFPVFAIQVEDKTAESPSKTDLDECLRVIEATSRMRFKEDEVVHSFGEPKNDIPVNGLNVHYREASQIDEDNKIKVVFFKQSLSTGWDCPRAEVMMSFRVAEDYTYIAQLMGRIVRNPLHIRIESDVTLNEVRLFLPKFDYDTTNKVVKALKDEGIASKITSNSDEGKEYQTLNVAEGMEDVVEWINSLQLTTYIFGKSRVGNYLTSLYKLANLILVETPHATAKSDITKRIVFLIKEYIQHLKDTDTYTQALHDLDEFLVKGGSFAYLKDEEMKEIETRSWQSLEYDIEKEYKMADQALAGGEIAIEYLKSFDDTENILEYKKHIILFVQNCMDELKRFAQKKFDDYKFTYRKELTRKNEMVRAKYERIVKEQTNAPATYQLYFPMKLPTGEMKYGKHLFVDEEGTFSVHFDSGWEDMVLKEEMKHESFVCWIRNLSGKQQPLCLRRLENNEMDEHPFYPDFIVIHKEKGEYTFNILEPHRDDKTDNVSKARALCNYVREEKSIDRAELIRVVKGRIWRLEFQRSYIREEMKNVTTPDDLDRLFRKYNQE